MMKLALQVLKRHDKKHWVSKVLWHKVYSFKKRYVWMYFNKRLWYFEKQMKSL